MQPEKQEPIEGLEGHVMRIQVVDSVSAQRQIHYAIHFVGDLDAETKKSLINLITSLK